MESHDSYPVFHTRLTRTYRRRLTRLDGTPAGWLITTGPAAAPASRDTVPSLEHIAADRDDFDDPPHLAIPRPR